MTAQELVPSGAGMDPAFGLEVPLPSRGVGYGRENA